MGQIMKRPKRKSEHELIEQVTAWNDHRAVGTDVIVRLDDGTDRQTKTTSEAWVMGGHSAMIKVEGISGGYDLDRVRPVS